MPNRKVKAGIRRVTHTKLYIMFKDEEILPLLEKLEILLSETSV